jgi:2-polyprenyl-3-methyl-5-hydroxy-6-metoxy-1,4-benzoquinol methylase
MTKLRVQFHYSDSHALIDLLLSISRTRLLNLIELSKTGKCIVDIGCSSGALTRVLAQKSPVVGLDIDKPTLVWLKKHSKNIELICADVGYLPFREESVDVAVVSSVLEHAENLDETAKQMESMLKKDGMVVAGYPIETRLVKAVVELVSNKTVNVWDARRVMSDEDYMACPDTHKQTFSTIRDTLRRHFLVVKKDKMPATCLPDFLSIYECVRLSKRS